MTDSNPKNDNGIGYDADGNCAVCHGPLDRNYGLAGGGIGIYDFCDNCGEVVWKEQDNCREARN